MHSSELELIIGLMKAKEGETGRCVACMAAIRSAHKTSARKHEQKRPLTGCGKRWDGDVKMDLKEWCVRLNCI